MKLTFLYAPTTDLAAALTFYRDTLGLEEAWREGDETVVFALPDSDVQLMVSVDAEGAAAPIYLVDDVRAFLSSHPAIDAEPMDIPDGTMATFTDPAGNPISVLDQAAAE
jgi:catechol 2,3-dioxygenase-like lactoylglutathione lyase family enzyme